MLYPFKHYEDSGVITVYEFVFIAILKLCNLVEKITTKSILSGIIDLFLTAFLIVTLWPLKDVYTQPLPAIVASVTMLLSWLMLVYILYHYILDVKLEKGITSPLDDKK